MTNCADDLTQIDYDASAAANSHLASSTSSSSSNSLFPLIEFTHSHALNIQSNDPDNALKRVLRPLDSRDTVLDNEEVVGTEHEGNGGMWTAGSIETQEGDDELLIHVRFSELVRIKTILIGTGGGRLSTSPRLCRVWVNRGPGGTTFEEAAAAGSGGGQPKPAQEFELLESEGGQRGAVEYPVRIARFANCSDVDLYFVRIRCIVFLGCIPPRPALASFAWITYPHTDLQAHARGEQTRLYYLGFIGESRVLKKEANEPMTIGAENAAPSLLDGVKEEKRGGATTSAR
ncbi:hypothetical protein JCM10908_004669 [Rhodotorula pacifica]|uniref:PITH domain-containing protein n=1 Tax=Rhodotorula pacifica TaxID=1495444 RepID=UPI0031800616